MARPPIDNPRTELIQIRVTPEDKAKLKARAERVGLSLSAYLLGCEFKFRRPGQPGWGHR